MSNRTAILFFTRSEQEELRVKNYQQSTLAVPYLIRRTRKLLAQTQLPVVEITDTVHLADSIQERFYLAMQSVFDAGYDQVIAVGNDCPQLALADLEEAKSLLKNNELVLGPDKRGGTYLLGISKAAFSRKWAMNLPWHSKHFCEKAATDQSSVAMVSTLADINTARDLRQLFGECLRKKLLKPLLTLLQPLPVEVTHKVSFLQSFHTLHFGLRAPPNMSW